MKPITETDDLAAFCARKSKAAFLTIDTEFMRESTYWPKLCLVQIGGPEKAACIDPLAEGLDLTPLFDLMRNPSVLKVFHSARQDIEIFVHLTGSVPAPVFDTQVAAMVCGFSESVGYETLVKRMTGDTIDKSSRFTDWSSRPLTDRQLKYALADVTHLRPVYEQLRDQIDQEGRESWFAEEMAILTNPATYALEPDDAWKRLRTRSTDGRFLAVLRELAAWREREAQRRDQPRSRVLRDETLLEIAAHTPDTPEALARTRGLSRQMADGRLGEAILATIAKGRAVPASDRPKVKRRSDPPKGVGPIVELLKVLLKASCEAHNVAPKLVANSADLEAIASDDEADVPALRSWRREVFGKAALDLKHGRVALAVDDGRLRTVPVGG